MTPVTRNVGDFMLQPDNIDVSLSVDVSGLNRAVWRMRLGMAIISAGCWLGYKIGGFSEVDIRDELPLLRAIREALAPVVDTTSMLLPGARIPYTEQWQIVANGFSAMDALNKLIERLED